MTTRPPSAAAPSLDGPGLLTMIKQIFARIQPTKVIEDQLHDAKIQALQHEAAAEHHAALAQMYRKRIDRLNRDHVANVGTQQSS